MLVVPAQVVRARRVLGRGGQGHAGTVQGVVAVAVVVIEFQPRTHFDSVLWRDGDVALIEQSVQVGPEENPVADFMWAVLRIWLEMGRFQRRQGMLVRYGAGSGIGIHHCHTEDTLAEARLSQLWRPVAWGLFTNQGQPTG